MKVQLLTFPGCPNADAARDALRRAVVLVGARVEIEEVDTGAGGTADHLRGWGSPTILVDGRDVGGESAPGATSCRIYRDAAGRPSGTPSAELIAAALERGASAAGGSARAGAARGGSAPGDSARGRRGRGRTSGVAAVAALPGMLLPLLPSVTCPACLPAYAGVLSALGLGFLLNDRVLAPLVALSLVIGLASLVWSARSHRRRGPLVAMAAGAAGVVAGRFLWSLPPLLYAGLALVIVASVWNLWLKRPRRAPLVQVRPAPPA